MALDAGALILAYRDNESGEWAHEAPNELVRGFDTLDGLLEYLEGRLDHAARLRCRDARGAGNATRIARLGGAN